MSEIGQRWFGISRIHARMLNADTCYRALQARDRRFDGCFYVGVKSTGIYCRAVCPARTPSRASCAFFELPAQAEHAGFRACLRCRPEVAPGVSTSDSPGVVARAVQAIHDGFLSTHSLEELGGLFGVTDRHLRRLFVQELGVSPQQVFNTWRLRSAKQLLHDSSLPVTEIAFASGFESVRAFNSAFAATFRQNPTAVRRSLAAHAPADAFTLRLDVRPPFAWDQALAFLKGRAIPGVEAVSTDRWAHTWSHAGETGVISARYDPSRPALAVTIERALAPGTSEIARRVRTVFDLDASPSVIDAALSVDPLLAPRVRATPGLRVPGTLNAFEVCVRIILGQQVSVAAASTLAGRVVERFGTRLKQPQPGLTHLFPPASALAKVSVDGLASLGLPRQRAAALHHLALAFPSIERLLQTHAPVDVCIELLLALPGVGPWTAQYLAMRLWRAPDAFPASDLVLRRVISRTAKDVLARSERWRPFRAYAAMHLWNAPEVQRKRNRR